MRPSNAVINIRKIRCREIQDFLSNILILYIIIVAVKKPRSKTYDVIPETENISSGNTLNYQSTTNSDLINKSEVLLCQSQSLFMNSRFLKPRHSVYIYHSPMNFDSTPEQIDSNPQLSFNEISADKPMFGIHLESSQQDYSDNSVEGNLNPELIPVLAHQNTGSFLSDTIRSLKGKYALVSY